MATRPLRKGNQTTALQLVKCFIHNKDKCPKYKRVIKLSSDRSHSNWWVIDMSEDF